MEPILVGITWITIGIMTWLISGTIGYVLGRHCGERSSILEMRGRRNIVWLVDKETGRGQYVWADDMEPIRFLKGVGE